MLFSVEDKFIHKTWFDALKSERSKAKGQSLSLCSGCCFALHSDVNSEFTEALVKDTPYWLKQAVTVLLETHLLQAQWKKLQDGCWKMKCFYFFYFQDINVCILENYPECSNPRVFYIIPYFCGQHPQCRYLTLNLHDNDFCCNAQGCSVCLFGLSFSHIFLFSPPGSQEFGLWRGPNRMCWKTTSLLVSWKSWRMFCSC